MDISASKSHWTIPPVSVYHGGPVARNPADKSYRIVGIALIALGCLAIAFGEPFVAIPLFLLGLVALCGSKAIKFAVNVLINCCVHSSQRSPRREELPTTRPGQRTQPAQPAPTVPTSQLQGAKEARGITQPRSQPAAPAVVVVTTQPTPPAQPTPAVPTSQLQGAKDARGILQPAAQTAMLSSTGVAGSTERAGRPGSSCDDYQKPLKRNKNAHQQQTTHQPAAVPPGNAGGLSLLTSSVVYAPPAEPAPSAPSQMGLALESRGISGNPAAAPNASMFASYKSRPAAAPLPQRAPAPASRVNETPAAPPSKETKSLSSSSSASGQRGAEPGSRRKGP